MELAFHLDDFQINSFRTGKAHYVRLVYLACSDFACAYKFYFVILSAHHSPINRATRSRRTRKETD